MDMLNVLFVTLLFSVNVQASLEFYYPDSRHLPLLEKIPHAEPGKICMGYLRGKIGSGFTIFCDYRLGHDSYFENDDLIWLKTLNKTVASAYIIDLMDK